MARDLVCYWSAAELGMPMVDLARKFDLTPAAMVVASANFPGSAAIAAVFVYAIFSTLGTLALVFLVRRVGADQ